MESLKREFLELLEKDLEFRYAIAGYLGFSEILKRLDGLVEEQTKIWEEIAKIWEEVKALREEQTRLREDMVAGFRRHDEEIAKLRADMIEGFNLLRRHIDALGARWGIISEAAFREGLKGLLEEEFGFRVEKWVRYEDKGFVFGYPSRVDIDVAVKDGRMVLIEVKSHVYRENVYNFRRKGEFYKIIEGKAPARLIIVTPYADEGALEVAKELGIEIYTKV
ncbi:MAG: DUF3782 domain-containing protein [Candidatus Bathyarchaeia archaeon]